MPVKVEQINEYLFSDTSNRLVGPTIELMVGALFSNTGLSCIVNTIPRFQLVYNIGVDRSEYLRRVLCNDKAY